MDTAWIGIGFSKFTFKYLKLMYVFVAYISNKFKKMLTDFDENVKDGSWKYQESV